MKATFRILVLAAVSLILTSVNGSAQIKNKPNIWYGFKIGTDVNTNDISGEVISEMKNNYRVGAFAQFGKKLFLQPEVYYARFVPEFGDAISAIVAPVSVGLELLDLKILSLNLKGGAEFSRQFTSDTKINYLWQGGIGVNILGFITTDVRYLLSKGESAFDQFGDLINSGGMLNVTVGFRFR
ncbi:MAG: hypothetical protein EOM23_04290 [Candidatus Moranbacteria bacterium]|nr:hypothetical protein [Candidatus Moranbacteria bacterium]